MVSALARERWRVGGRDRLRRCLGEGLTEGGGGGRSILKSAVAVVLVTGYCCCGAEIEEEDEGEKDCEALRTDHGEAGREEIVCVDNKLCLLRSLEWRRRLYSISNEGLIPHREIRRRGSNVFVTCQDRKSVV